MRISSLPKQDRTQVLDVELKSGSRSVPAGNDPDSQIQLAIF